MGSHTNSEKGTPTVVPAGRARPSKDAGDEGCEGKEKEGQLHGVEIE